MIKFKIILLGILLIYPLNSYADIKICQNGFELPYRCGNILDANVDLGAGGRHKINEVFFVRSRIGITHVSEPTFYTIGLTLETYTSDYKAWFGIQAEIMHMWTGLWAQLGATTNINYDRRFITSIGWSFIGAEGQMVDNEYIFLAKLRIPIGIAVALW